MRTSSLTTGPAQRSGNVRVLLFDSNVEDVRLVRDILEQEGRFRLQCTRSTSETEQALIAGMFDVALIESSLWSPDGANLARFAHDHHLDLAVVLLDAGDEELALSALKLGAHDVISKADLGDPLHVAGRILAAIDETRALRRRDTMVRWLEREARTDRLTGLLTRQAFDEQLKAACRAAHVCGESLALLLIDVTGTQQVNEAYGQLAGDAMIRRVARAVTRSIRGGDIAARIGGDDFGIVASGGDIDLARLMARRIAHEIERLNEQDSDGDIPVSVSFGVASGFACGPDELFAAANQQLSSQKSVRPALTPFFLRSEQDGPSVA